MPCTAKKFEAQRPEFAPDGRREVDAVLTTQELGRMIRAAGIVFNELEEEGFDEPFGFGTGAGVIYGASGGVATAVVRETAAILTGARIVDVALAPVEGLPGVRAAEMEVGDHTVRLAVVSGLGNARGLIAALDRGEASYDIVEVMACPGGCAGGGGQPVPNETAERRARARRVVPGRRAAGYPAGPGQPCDQGALSELAGPAEQYDSSRRPAHTLWPPAAHQRGGSGCGRR